MLLNEQDHTVRIVYTSSEGYNDIVTKKSSTSSIAFGSRSTLLTGGVNDVTSTKQNWTVTGAGHGLQRLDGVHGLHHR